ncbi:MULTISPECIES: HIRAN domain-containing protein [unclassified Aeromicrobium]|uniref:HIRAN domain-containing protein n=1 Tax=unclassified Aeromicrobium TaxID=2633570 RepID=UPI00396B2BA5
MSAILAADISTPTSSFLKAPFSGCFRWNADEMRLPFWRKRSNETRASPTPSAAHTPVRGVEYGPTWMPEQEWDNRLAAYRRQGRSGTEIAALIRHLEHRGPIKPRSKTEVVRAARSRGYVARAEFMDAETEARGLQPGPDGLPDAWLARERDRLLVTTPLGWVNPKSRTSWRLGIHSFALRGTGYYEDAVKAGRFTPGAPLRLVREPDNEYDTNAIAVYAETGRRVAGYVPKGQAKRLASLLDSGTDLVAVSVRGAGAGRLGATPHVLVCERELYEHLNR